MSSILGKRSLKTSKKSRDFTISAPFHFDSLEQISPTQRSPLAGPVVVLKVKYDFEAQESPEISVNKNELLVPIERRDDGWINVKCLDRHGKGLIPCLYVEIIVNDPVSPITMDWFSAPVLVEKLPVDRVIISQVSCDVSHKLWYRVEAVLGSDKVLKCFKSYKDFEDLVTLANKEYSSIKVFTIPPQLASHVSASKCSDTTKRDISIVAVGLNAFIQDLKRFLLKRDSTILLDFICNAKAFSEDGTGRPDISTTSIIVDLLNPKALDLLPLHKSHSHSFSPTAPLPPTFMGKSASQGHFSHLAYKNTNLKYLTYLQNMELSHSKTHKSDVSKSDSVTSLLSLIESYDVSSWDVYDQYPKGLALPQTSNADLIDKEDYEKKSGYRSLNLELDPLISTVSISDSNGSSTASNYRNSDLTKNTEPFTPSLTGQSILSFILPSPIDFSTADYDLSPLQPRMHIEFLSSMKRFKSANL